MSDPALLNCNQSAPNATAAHVVADADGSVVIDVPANVTNTHPTNRVWSEPGRLMSAGGQQFLNGGRYLVICMNRVHFFDDWMFGFVNVGGDD